MKNTMNFRVYVILYGSILYAYHTYTFLTRIINKLKITNVLKKWKDKSILLPKKTFYTL